MTLSFSLSYRSSSDCVVNERHRDQLVIGGLVAAGAAQDTQKRRDITTGGNNGVDFEQASTQQQRILDMSRGKQSTETNAKVCNSGRAILQGSSQM